MKRMWLMLSILLIVLSSAALAEEFTVVTYGTNFITEPLDSAVCSCADDTVAFGIANLGSFPTAYTISSEQGLALSAQAVVLDPQQQIIITAQVPSQCGVYGEGEPLTFRVQDGFNQEQRVTIIPQRQDCLESSFALDAVNKTVSACAPIESTLYITNQGQVTETYAVFTDPATTSLSASAVTLPAQTTGQIDATFRYACGTTGSETLEFDIQTENEGLTYVVAQDITFEDNYSFTIEGSESIEHCQEESGQQILRITNPQAFPNQFTAQLEGATGLSLSEETFWLGPNSEKEIILTSNLSSAGTYDFTVSVDGLYGEYNVQYNDSVTVNNCYDIDLAGFTQRKFVCQEDSFSEDLTLINTGTEEITVGLVLAGSENVALEDSIVTIAQNESVQVPLLFAVNETGKETVRIEAYRNGEIIAQKSFPLTSDSLATCYGLDVPSRVRVEFDETEFTLPVQNDGTRYGTYDITATDDQDTLFALDTQVALGRTEKTNIPFAVLNTVEIGDVYNLSLSFTHEQSNEQFDYLVQVQITNDPWWQRASQSIMTFCQETDRCHKISMGLLLLILVAVAFIVFREYSNRIYTFRLPIFLIAIALALISLLVVYATQGIPQLYEENDLSGYTTTNLLLEEDTPRVFNLSGFFFDPDGDIELYGLSDLDETVLAYTLEGDQLRLIPETDWSGSTMIKLFAVDAEGAIAESQSIRVDVFEVADYSVWGYYDVLCAYVNVFLFWVLLVLLVTLLFYPKGEAKPEKKTYY